MERYYDAHLYLANWGTRRILLRLPRGLLDLDVVGDYCVDERVTAWTTSEFLLLDLTSEDESGDVDPDAGAPMSALIGVRTELAAGDLRPLYLAWLAGHGTAERDEYSTGRRAGHPPRATRAAPDWPPSARRSAPWPNFSASTTTCSPSRPARAHRSTPAAGRRKSHGDRPDGDASSIPQRSTPQTCPPHLAGPWPIFSRPRRVAEATMSAGQLPGAPGRKPAGTRPVVSHRRDDRHPKVRRVRRRRRTAHRSPDARRTRRRRDTFTQRILALRHTHARKPRLIERLNRAGL